MPKTLVVGDSVAVGIGGAIAGAQVLARTGLRIDQMQPFFDQAIAAAGQGDTVILSAGYNSTGPNGLSASDITLLQANIDRLAAKGAQVILAPLRETGMTGDYARLNGQTARSNAQLRGLRHATVAEQCVATANGIARGEIHGAYADLARICQTASTAANENAALSQSPAATATPTTSGGGIMGFLASLWDAIVGFFTRLFGGAATPAPPAAPAASRSASAAAAASTSNPELARAQARDAAGQSTVTGGQDVAAADAPTSPATGTRGRRVG